MITVAAAANAMKDAFRTFNVAKGAFMASRPPRQGVDQGLVAG